MGARPNPQAAIERELREAAEDLVRAQQRQTEARRAAQAAGMSIMDIVLTESEG